LQAIETKASDIIWNRIYDFASRGSRPTLPRAFDSFAEIEEISQYLRWLHEHWNPEYYGDSANGQF